MIVGANSATAKAFISKFSDSLGEIFCCDLSDPYCEELSSVWHKCDLASQADITGVVRAVQPAQIYNFAGTFSNNYDVDYQANVLLPRFIFEAVLSLQLKTRILLIGSSAEYGLINELDNPVSEDHGLNPVSVYGLTKAFQTQLMRYYVAVKGSNAVMARTFNILSPNMSEKLFVGRLYKQIEQFKAGQIEKISLGNLDNSRDYISIEDAVEKYHIIMENGLNGAVYNVGTGCSITIRALLMRILGENGLSMENISVADFHSATDVKNIFADVQAFEMLRVGPHCHI